MTTISGINRGGGSSFISKASKRLPRFSLFDRFERSAFKVIENNFSRKQTFTSPLREKIEGER